MRQDIPLSVLLEMLHGPAFDAAMPRFVAYAHRRLRRVGWGTGRDGRSCEEQVEDLIGDTFVACCEGERTWKGGVEFEVFFCNAMRSVLYNKHRAAKARRPEDIEDVGELAAPSSRRDAAIDARLLLAAVKEVLARSPDTEALGEVLMAEEKKRAELMARLGWSAEKFETVRAKMNRRLAAAGLSHGEDDEEGSPRDRSPRAAPAPRRGAR